MYENFLHDSLSSSVLKILAALLNCKNLKEYHEELLQVISELPVEINEM